jgi:hypothetical protein
MRHFEAAQHAFRSFDLAEAKTHLERVRELAPGHVGARNGLVKIQRRETEIAQARLAFETARAGLRLSEAWAALDTWQKIVDPASTEIREAIRSIATSLKRAEALAAKAREQERTNPPLARSIYRQSLAIAADLPAALRGLERTPPDPPSSLEAEVLGDRIRLRWNPPPPDGLGPLTFIIVRKRGGVLSHPAEGSRIGETTASEFDDLHAPPGQSVGYAVLSRRNGLDSIAAVSLGPFILLADVADVLASVQRDDAGGKVTLSWKPPAGVAEVRVVRKMGVPPRDPRDGERLVGALDHLIDPHPFPSKGDVGEVDIYYRIYAVFRMPDGRLFPSPGVVVRPPTAEPVADQRSETRRGLPLPSTGGPVSEPEPSLRREPVGVARSYWTSAVSRPLGLSRAAGLSLGRGTGLPADPSDLRAIASRDGRTPGGTVRVVLRWRWSPSADLVRIVAKRDARPLGPDDSESLSFDVSKREYERLDSWTIHLPSLITPPSTGSGVSLPTTETNRNGEGSRGGLGRWLVRVYSLTTPANGEAPQASPGLEPSAEIVVPGPIPEITIAYSLRRPWFPGRSYSVSFRTEPVGLPIPPLVLVVNARAVPLSVDDGEIVARFPAARDGGSIPVRSSVDLRSGFARVFLDPSLDPDELPPVRLRHPDAAETRV